MMCLQTRTSEDLAFCCFVQNSCLTTHVSPCYPKSTHRRARHCLGGNGSGATGPAPCRASVGERWGKQVELFLSTYVNKVDRKGRVSVPATFRSTPATPRETNRVAPSPSLRGPAPDGARSKRAEGMS